MEEEKGGKKQTNKKQPNVEGFYSQYFLLLFSQLQTALGYILSKGFSDVCLLSITTLSHNNTNKCSFYPVGFYFMHKICLS